MSGEHPDFLWRNPSPKASYEVVIVGAGGHGLATAYYLARNHGVTDVAVLERGWLAGGNITRNTTIIRSNYLWDESAAIYEHSLKLWEGLEAELDYDLLFSQRGVLNLAHTLQDVRASVRRVVANRLSGIDAEWLDPAQVAEVCPIVNVSPEARYPVLGGVGMCRYAIMCTLDGMVFDDGVVMHVGEQRFVCTTTTGNAAPVLAWMEEWLQTEWPELRVWLTSVTEQWATVAVVGPDSRALLAGLTAIPLGREAFPFMAIREGVVAGIPARVCRVSFSGELAYEVNVDGRRGLELWQALDATPYGTETMHILRAEKGYPIVGQDTDGTVTPQDLGMDWIVSKAKPDFIGKRSFSRADTARPDRKQLVGLLPAERVPEGTQLVAEPGDTAMLGHVTSSYDSVALGRPFSLALVRSGRERIGETVYADGIAAEIVDSVLYDPEGARRAGRPA